MKIVKVFIIALLFVFGISNVGLAKENNDGNSSLTEKEYQYLLKNGHTEEEIKDLPIEVAKQLVKDKAIKQNSGYIIKNFYEASNEESGEFFTTASISSSELKLAGTVYKVTSDRSGYNKYYIYANFQWLKSPFWTLTDKMTIGFPSSSGFFLPTSNGSVTQHQHRYSYDAYGNGNWVDTPIKYTPSDWDPNAGVAGSYDLKKLSDFTLHKGYIGQYVYVRNTVHGDMNIKIEYGHRMYGGSPSVSVFPAGLSITPSSWTDTASYALTLTY
ncbi:hypothetical protein [Aeribacillus alveayuensis]|uniref:Uncharacterized protein n=1 Tax=Aeribacillus alveayuensis TaxID=279215 RepID=A0ABT9VT18_9BACI|nr:hypothetical protein [Bacillus alveayuensis]